MSLVIASRARAQIVRLPVGAHLSGELSGSQDVHYYQVDVAAGQHLIVLLDQPGRWYSHLTLRHARLPDYYWDGDDYKSGYDDQNVEIESTESGSYYVRVQGDRAASYVITALTAEMMPTLTLGVGQAGEFSSSQDVHYYRIDVAAGQHLIVLLDKSERWYGHLDIRAGRLPDYASDGEDYDSGYDDQHAEIGFTEAGSYYARVEADQTASYTITALTAERMPRLTLGVGQTGQLSSSQDVHYYQVDVAAGQHLIVLLDQPGRWYSHLTLRHARLPDYYWDGDDYKSGYDDQNVEIESTESGSYYVRVQGDRAASYVITALTAEMMPTLTLGVGQAGEFSSSQDVHYYRIDVAAGQHLIVLLDKSERWYGHLDIRVGRLPDYASDGEDYDSGYDDQHAEIGFTEAGSYYTRVEADQMASYVITASVDVPSLSVNSVSPRQPGNGVVSLTVGGSGFQEGATVRLSRDGQPEIYAFEVVRDNHTRLTARFDLSAQPPGTVWHAWVDNPGGSSAGLLDAIRIGTAQANLWTDIVGPGRLRVGRNETYRIRYGNSGGVDTFDVLLIVKVPRTVEFEVVQQRPEIEGVDWTQIPQGLDDGYEVIIPIWVYRIAANYTGEVQLKLTLPVGQWTGGRRFSLNVELRQAPSAFSRTGDAADLEGSLTFQRLRAALATAVCSSISAPPEFCTVPSEVVRLTPLDSRTGATADLEGNQLEAGLKKAALKLVIGAVAFTILGIIPVALGEAGLIGYAGLALVAITYLGAKTFYDDFTHVQRVAITGAFEGTAVQSWDPNLKVGPTGFGAQRFMASERELEYIIFIENLASATAEAEDIVITETLDAGLDWDTLSIGETLVGGQPYRAVSITTNPASRTISWAFAAVNLPPNCAQQGARPECLGLGKGEGSVSFGIKPASGLSTGVQIRNKATIVFDVNPPLNTNEVLYTIDAEAPASRVLSLPGEQDAERFSVSWEGDDETGGSGVRDYSVYVRRDGGPAEPWLLHTAESGAAFAGRAEHCYAFYSVAQDNVGNREATPAEPDAFTCVRANATPSRPCVGDCDGSGSVSVTDVITMVNIALGNMPLSACFAGDEDGSGTIVVTEIIKAVNNAVSGCPF